MGYAVQHKDVYSRNFMPLSIAFSLTPSHAGVSENAALASLAPKNRSMAGFQLLFGGRRLSGPRFATQRWLSPGGASCVFLPWDTGSFESTRIKAVKRVIVSIIRSHRSNSHIYTAYCHRRSSVVFLDVLSVGHIREPCKNG